MGLFWRRKNKDEFVTLGLNERPAARPVPETPTPLEPPAATTEQKETALDSIAPEPAITGAAPTPSVAPPAVTKAPVQTPPEPVVASAPRPAAAAVPPTRSPFASTSILGLNRSMEELQAEEAALEQAFSARFRRAVSATRDSLSERLDSVFQNRKQIDAELLDELEEALIAADIGVPTTLHILEMVRRGVARKQIDDVAALKNAIKTELLSILRATEKAGVASETSVPDNVAPYVMMVVGVNGVGKTTTIGKLAQRIKAEGNDVLICAADTFRAAASDQLAIWAERTGVPLIQQREGTDPAAVLFDSLKAAKARQSDVLIVDTAGRLHNKSNLMAELEKMKRVASREVEAAPHETLLVIDAVTGQNGLEQARQFLKVAGVTGIVLTKLDGTAKGGIAVAIAKELNLPIRYVGIGEKVDDLVVFDPEQYVNGLFD
ncbi:MAG TPA: signal recognition particle-docking protein FtsY [Pyrinomonadaceae bacterium]|nr:signal recognition particle-docking protein FtsY [Pyrinomonadaceae bacterium]